MQFPALAVKFLALRLAVDQPAARQPGPGDDGAVFQDVHVLDDAVFLAVARHIADAQRQRLLGGVHLHGLAAHDDVALILARIAKDGAEDLTAAVAQKARHAQHLARAHAQADMAVVRLLGQILQAEHLVAKGGAAVQGLVAHVVAHHVAGQQVGGHIPDVALRHHHAVAQHRIAVTDLHDLAQLVGDKDDANVLLFQRAQDLKYVLDLRVGQRGGGFVHDDDLGVHQKRAGNLHDLLVGGVQVAHHGAGVQAKRHALKYLPGFRDHARMVQKAVFLFQLPADEHVLIDREVVDEVQFLMDEGDARVQRLAGVLESLRLVVQQNLPRVGPEHAAQNIHQRAFARAVLAQQRADFPAAKRKIDGFQHVVRAEGFHDPTHGEVHLFTSVLKILLKPGKRAMAPATAPFEREGNQ